jgi:hypothetical protein
MVRSRKESYWLIMAGDWLKIEICTPDKPEVIGIADILGIPPAHAFGSLFFVWRWFDQHTTCGNASYVTKVTIDRLSGNAGFADAMVKVGWLTINNDGSVTLPHFDTHNGETAKQRGLTAKRVAKSKLKSNDKSNEKVTDDALPREEKRIEEKKEEKHIAIGKPNCPHQEIINLYHEILPASPAIRDWTPARAASLKARWNEDTERQTLDYWKRLFEYIAGIPFLTGRVASNGRKPFLISLDWLVKAENFAKVREGRYEDQTA